VNLVVIRDIYIQELRVCGGHAGFSAFTYVAASTIELSFPRQKVLRALSGNAASRKPLEIAAAGVLFAKSGLMIVEFFRLAEGE
jgi:hypothetical protein